jgi:hypothetical protein
MGYYTNEERLLKKVSDAVRVGACGAILIDDTSTHSGTFSAVQAIGTADAVLSTDTVSDITDFAQVTIPKGVTIFGNFTAVDLVSGKVLAYKTCI